MHGDTLKERSRRGTTPGARGAAVMRTPARMGCQLVSILRHINPDASRPRPQFTGKTQRDVMVKQFPSTKFGMYRQCYLHGLLNHQIPFVLFYICCLVFSGGLVINVNYYYYCSHNSSDEDTMQQSADVVTPSKITAGREDVRRRKLVFTDSNVLSPENETGKLVSPKSSISLSLIYV